MLAIVTLCETLNPEQVALLKQVLEAMDRLYGEREDFHIQVINLTNEKTGRDQRIAELEARLEGATYSVSTYQEENQGLREENEALRKQVFNLSMSIEEFQNAEKLMADQREILNGVKRNVGEINQILSGFTSDWDGVPKEELGFIEVPKIKIMLAEVTDELPWEISATGRRSTVTYTDNDLAELLATCLNEGDEYQFGSMAIQEMAEKVTWNKLAPGKGKQLLEMLREYQETVDTVEQCWGSNGFGTWEDEFQHNPRLCSHRANIEAFLTNAYGDVKVPAEGSRWVSDSGTVGITEYNEDKTKWRFRYGEDNLSAWASVNTPIPTNSTWKEVPATKILYLSLVRTWVEDDELDAEWGYSWSKDGQPELGVMNSKLMAMYIYNLRKNEYFSFTEETIAHLGVENVREVMSSLSIHSKFPDFEDALRGLGRAAYENKRLAAEAQALVDTTPPIVQDNHVDGYAEPPYKMDSEGVVTETLEEDDSVDYRPNFWGSSKLSDSEGESLSLSPEQTREMWQRGIKVFRGEKVATPEPVTEIQNVESAKEVVIESIKLKLKRQYLQALLDECGCTPHKCLYCGKPSEVDPSDQVRPADQCHEEDHKSEPPENEAAQPVPPIYKITYSGVNKDAHDVWLVERNGTTECMKNSQLAHMLTSINSAYVTWTQSYITNLTALLNFTDMSYPEAMAHIARIASQYTNRNQRGE